MRRGGMPMQEGTTRRGGPNDTTGQGSLPCHFFLSFKSRAEQLCSLLILLYIFCVPRHIPKEESLLGNNEFISYNSFPSQNGPRK